MPSAARPHVVNVAIAGTKNETKLTINALDNLRRIVAIISFCAGRIAAVANGASLYLSRISFYTLDTNTVPRAVAVSVTITFTYS